MDAERFNRLVNERLLAVVNTVSGKRAEYAVGHDVLVNFKEGVRLSGETGGPVQAPEQVLWGYLLKHLVSVRDLVEGRKQPTRPVLAEKLGDVIVYTLLLEGLLTERMGG